MRLFSWCNQQFLLKSTYDGPIINIQPNHTHVKSINADKSILRALGNDVCFVGNTFPTWLTFANLTLLAFKEVGWTGTLWGGLFVVWAQIEQNRVKSWTCIEYAS